MTTLLTLTAAVPLTDPAVAAAVAKADWVNLLSLVVQTAGTVIVAIGVPYIAYKQARLNIDMRLLEQNTNSIKDELVRATREAGLLQGAADERDKDKGDK